MNNKVVLESMSMDLKRVALGYYRNSISMADRFYQESLKRKQEVVMKDVKPYMKFVLHRVDLLKYLPLEEKADEALMLSTLIQNYTQVFL